MTIRRLDHVSVVVDDLAAAIAFFTALGMTLEGQMPVEGPWVDRVNGLEGASLSWNSHELRVPACPYVATPSFCCRCCWWMPPVPGSFPRRSRTNLAFVLRNRAWRRPRRAVARDRM